MSDLYGRKPVLLLGLCGTALTVLCFGLATSLGVAIAARVMGGLLNANQEAALPPLALLFRMFPFSTPLWERKHGRAVQVLMVERRH